MLKRKILYYGKHVILACDGNCDKAWGIQIRPRVQLSTDEDDIAYLADQELDIAPEEPGTWEGGHGKDPGSLNKWCARQCERSGVFKSVEEIKLHDFSKRLYNIPTSDPEHGIRDDNSL